MENGTLFCEKLSPPSVETNCGRDSLALWLNSATTEDELPMRAATSPPVSWYVPVGRSSCTKVPPTMTRSPRAVFARAPYVFTSIAEPDRSVNS